MLKVNQKYFTLVRKDVLDNPDLSLSAKGLYCLICYDVTKSLRKLLLDPTNLQALCRECHEEVHRQLNKKIK